MSNCVASESGNHATAEEDTQHKIVVTQTQAKEVPTLTQAQVQPQRCQFVKMNRGWFILGGLIIFLMLLGGVGIGMSIVMASNYTVIQKTHIHHSGNKVMEISQVQNSKEDSTGRGYRIFATRSISKNSRRLLTTEKQPEIDVHYVFGENSEMVITVHSNSTFRIYLNPNILAEQIQAENQAFEELVERYQNNGTELAPEIISCLKVLFNEVFSNTMKSEVRFTGQQRTGYLLNSNTGKMIKVKNDQVSGTSKRLLSWADFWGGVATGAIVVVALLNPHQISDTISNNIDTPVISKIDGTEDLSSGNAQYEQPVHECIPLSTTQISCNIQSQDSTTQLVSQ